MTSPPFDGTGLLPAMFSNRVRSNIGHSERKNESRLLLQQEMLHAAPTR
jgi:hypothetical protein